MKLKSKNLLFAILIGFATFFTVLITNETNLVHAAEKVDFSIKEHFDVYFESTGSNHNYPVTLTNENKLSVPIPQLYRTDTLDFVFDGWYIADTDTKINQDYVFDGYTVVVDRWIYSEFDSNYKVSNIEINNPELAIGTKQGEYIANVAVANVDGITATSGVNFTIYKGLNKSGDPLVDDETIEIGKNYSAVTTITLKDGYKFDDQLRFTSDNGLCAELKFRGNFFEYMWSSLANQVEVVINFIGDDEYYFSQQPESREFENYTEYHYWYAIEEPDDAESLEGVTLQYKDGESWAIFGPAINVVSPYADRTITFRLMADYGTAGVIYSEPWTITWKTIDATIDNIALGVATPLNGNKPSYAKTNSDPRYYQAYENNSTTQNGVKWSGSLDGDLEVGNATFNNSNDYTVSIKLIAQEGYSFDIANLTAEVNANNAQVTGTSEEVVVTYTFEKAAPKTHNVSFSSGLYGTGTMEDVDVEEGHEYELPDCGFTAVTNYQFSSWSVDGQLKMPGDVIKITNNTMVHAIWQGVSTPVAEGFTTQPTGGTTATGAVFTTSFVVDEGISFNSVDVLKYNIDTDSWDSFNSSRGIIPVTTEGRITAAGFSSSTEASEILRIYAYRDGNAVAKSDIFTVNWVDCEFTEQPQGAKILIGSTYTFTWETNFEVSRYRILSFDGEDWSAIAETTENTWSVTSDEEKSLTYQVRADMSYLMENGNTNYAYDVAISQSFVVTWGEAPTPEYMVSYEANGGAGTMVGDVITAGEQFTLEDCTYDAPIGKRFAGWAVGDVDARPLLQAGEKITINEPTIIYAIWEKYPTSLTASYNGTVLAGNKLSIPSLTVKLIYSDSSEMPCAGLAQYWYNGSQIQDPINYVFGVELIGNLEITVKYQGLETTFELQVVGHEITFNSNTGTGTMEADEYVGDYTLPTNGFTAPAGKQFKGWSTSSNGAVIEGTTYNVNEPVEFFAIWEELPATPETLTATYTGTILAGTTINPAGISITLTYSDDSIEPVNAGNVEYWYGGSEITNPIAYVFGVELIGNLNITIKYEGLETTMAVTVVGHEITFNANGGTGTMTATEYVGSYTLPANGFTAPEGKQFKGWSTSVNGTIIEGTTYNVTAPVELFAIWEDIPVVTYTVTFNANGGTGTMTEVSNIAGNYTLPSNGFTAPEGKHFKGWATSATGNVIEGTTYNVTSDTTLYAIWEDNSAAGPATPEQPENKGLGAGAIVGIVMASLVVLGTGGFAVVWFIVKKKTWADFVAIFKKK